MPMSTPGLSDFMPTKDVEEYQYAEERSFPLIISLLQHIALKVVQFRLFFHFGGNSLRRVHVFLRDQKKTYHPFFEPEMGV